MSVRNVAISIGILLLLAGGWYLASPLFFDTTVNEQFPAPTGLTEEERAEVRKMEMLTQEEVSAMPEEEQMAKKMQMQELGEKMPDTVMEEPMETGPEVLVQGSFRDADSFHKGSGTATIYTLPDGKRVLRFENFSVTNGPSLNVYLVQSSDGAIDSGYLDLGKLKGNKGDQNYEIPAGVDLSQYKSIIIWCVPFKVTFAVAALQ